MGACATKPRVSKDGAAEGAAPAPEVKEEEATVSEVKEVVVVAEEGTAVHAEGSGGAEAEEPQGEDVKPRSLDILLKEDEVKEISGQDEPVPPPSEEPKKQDEPEIKAAQSITATSTAEKTTKDVPVVEVEENKPAEEKPKSETQQIVPETEPVVETKKAETEEKPATVAVTEEKK